MATGVRTADPNAVGNFMRQMRLLEKRVADLETKLAALDVGGKRHRRDPAERVIEAA